MKNKTTKILAIISVVILGLGVICWFGTNSLINESDNVALLFSLFGAIALRLLIVSITGGLIGLIWLIYGIIILIKKIKSGQFKYKNFLIVGISLVLIIIAFTTLSSLLNRNNIGFKKNKYDYNIIYQDGVNLYNIYKTGNKIEVYADEQVICIKDPCPPIKSIRKINFSRDNMKIVNNFIDSLFGYHEYKTIQIFRENLNQEQNNILDSIIYNDESLLNKESAEISGKYTIITDMRWKTMQNDGGSNTSIYYEINLDNNIITKIKEAYHANLGGTPTTKKNVLYTKQLDDSHMNETKKLIEEIINKEDINISSNYHCFTIESINIKKDIYNIDTIENINNLLTKFDNYDKKNDQIKSILVSDSYFNYAWGISFNGNAIFDDGTIYSWNFHGDNENEYRKFIGHNNIETKTGLENFILNKADIKVQKVSNEDLQQLKNRINNLLDEDTNFVENCHGADMGTNTISVYKNGKELKISEHGDCDGNIISNNTSHILSLINKYTK